MIPIKTVPLVGQLDCIVDRYLPFLNFLIRCLLKSNDMGHSRFLTRYIKYFDQRQDVPADMSLDLDPRCRTTVPKLLMPRFCNPDAPTFDFPSVCRIHTT